MLEPEQDNLNTENTESAQPSPEDDGATQTVPNTKKPRFSGAYWYVPASNEDIAKNATIRTLLVVIAVMLQVVVLLLPQGGLEYVTLNIPSYAFIYMWSIFVILGVTVYTLIMNFTRNKLRKRIPVEYAPRSGFARRSFLSNEIFMAINALILIFELSFVCISYDGWGLVALFVSAAALAASVAARQIVPFTLKGAERIEAADESENK